MTQLSEAKMFEGLRMAYDVAGISADPSTQNGVIIVHVDQNGDFIPVAVGANNMLGDESPERWERPAKYSYVEHAERMAIYHAARNGVATNGATMFAAWAACSDCARAIVAAGITTLITHRPVSDGLDHEARARWNDSIHIGDHIMVESGVEVISVRDTLGCKPLRRDGRLWQP